LASEPGSRINATPRGLCLLGLFAIGTIGIALAGPQLGHAFAQVESAEQVVIYYGNETTPAAAGSRNYTLLLQALRVDGGADGPAIADGIADDATISPAVAGNEVDALVRSCGRLPADIAIFTNAMAMSGSFMFCRQGSGVTTLPFTGPPPASDRILNRTPLSRPEYLRAALERTATAVGKSPIEAVLLVHSHGSIDMALMPRVSADIEDLDPSVLRRGLQLRRGTPDWATLKGTTKLDLWGVLADASNDHGMRFALVFRQACESGPASLAEYAAIPENVTWIAHTAMADLPSGKIDYPALLAAAAAAADPVEGFVANLHSQGIRVDGRSALLVWLVPVYLWSIPTVLFFLPLAAWLCRLLFACMSGPKRSTSSPPKPA